MRSTGKCDIIYFVKKGKCCMKTKIIYISGNEIFDMRDIRAAFEEVRTALNLDKTTVLFGVPVDAEDAGFATKTPDLAVEQEKIEPVEIAPEPVIETTIVEETTEITPIQETTDEKIESVAEEQPVKKRGRPRKEDKIETVVEPVKETIDEPAEDSTDEQPEETKETVVPILSVLAVKEEDIVPDVVEEETENDIAVIPEINDEIVEPVDETETSENEIIEEDDAAKLERLLSAMKPLEEDILEEQHIDDIAKEQDSESDSSFDATLEQLASEFIENQDKIAAEAKQTSRSKIGKLRNILPFKQSKHKDSGLGDLFGWAGIAANDEDFSVPGFFTSAASKK